jgi:hypothetical protein
VGFEIINREGAKDAKKICASRSRKNFRGLPGTARRGKCGVSEVKKLLICFLIFFASCAPVVGPAAAESLPTLTSTPWVIASPESTPTIISPSPTTAQIPCDPFAVDFCITDGHFIFQNPIFPSG